MFAFAIGARAADHTTVAQLDLSVNIPSLGNSQQRSRSAIEIDIVDGLTLHDLPPPHIVSILGKLAIFEVQEKTMQDIATQQIDRAGRRLETIATRLINIGENELARAALLEAGRLSRTGRVSPEGRKRIRYGTRTLTDPGEEAHDGHL